jgi:hypothetical protein
MGLSILFIPTEIGNSQSRIVEAMIKELSTELDEGLTPDEVRRRL